MSLDETGPGFANAAASPPEQQLSRQSETNSSLHERPLPHLADARAAGSGGRPWALSGLRRGACTGAGSGQQQMWKSPLHRVGSRSGSSTAASKGRCCRSTV